MEIALPAFITIVLMPFTYSIADGIAWGLISYVMIKLGVGKHEEIIENRILSICDYLNLEKNFDSFLNWILDLRKELNIPHKLSDVIESSKIDINKLSKMALEDPSTSTNPKKMTIDDMKILYEYSISGKLF